MLDFFRVTPKKRTIRLKTKSGVLYSNPPTAKKIVFIAGNFLFVMAVIYFGYLYLPLTKALAIYYSHKYSNTNNKNPTNNIAQVIQPINKEDFSIQIPKIFANSKIVADVSPYDKNEYLKILEKDQVAQSKTSSYPGSGNGNTTYIFAHSTQQGMGLVRKNSIFYLLGELQKEDPIYIKYDGKIYTYKVYKQIVVDPKMTEYMNYVENDKEVLILQTCWPIGTDWKRLLVFAQLVQ